MRLGVCWYPEQWPESDWADDARQMADIGLQVVRVGEFAWSRIEPREGVFDFGWMDRALDVLDRAALRVVISTPTATPPVWLMRARPDIRSRGPGGALRPYGSRRHTCPSSQVYREQSVRIASVLAERYGDLAHLDAWQIDNEPGNHDSARCWCEACQTAFRKWLAECFGDIDSLNNAWGQTFWSMSYPDFEAVDLPAPTITAHNPSLDLAHRRFASLQVCAGLALQREVLHDHSPGVPTFTNLYMGDVDIDAQAVHRPNGLGAIDNYPHGLTDTAEVAFNLDLARGAALQSGEGSARRGGRAWIVEQQPGPVNWTGDNPAVGGGEVTQWILDAAAQGIETLLIFRWRMARAAQEQLHGALLGHDRRPLQAYEEIAAVTAGLGDRVPERPPADAAVVVDYGDAWMIEVLPQTPDASHRVLAVAAYAALRQAGHVIDVVPADADLSTYPLVVLPAFHHVTPARLEAINVALAAGTTVVVGPRSLVADPQMVRTDQPVPAGLASTLGARVVQAGNPNGWPRGTNDCAGVRFGDVLVAAGSWVEILDIDATEGPDHVTVLATVLGGPWEGRPCAVRRGRLVHMGASSQAAWSALLATLD